MINLAAVLGLISKVTDFFLFGLGGRELRDFSSESYIFSDTN